MDSKVGAFHWLYESSDVDDINKLLETMEQRGMTIYGPRGEDVPADKRATPYPWCAGNPTKQDCIQAGYCRRDPNCGE